MQVDLVIRWKCGKADVEAAVQATPLQAVCSIVPKNFGLCFYLSIICSFSRNLNSAEGRETSLTSNFVLQISFAQMKVQVGIC